MAGRLGLELKPWMEESHRWPVRALFACGVAGPASPHRSASSRWRTRECRVPTVDSISRPPSAGDLAPNLGRQRDSENRSRDGGRACLSFWWSTFWCYSTSDPFQLRYSLLWALWVVVLGLLSIQVYTGSVTSCEACEPDRDRADRSVVHSCFGSFMNERLGTVGKIFLSFLFL